VIYVNRASGLLGPFGKTPLQIAIVNERVEGLKERR
jgi:hypothetical protein